MSMADRIKTRRRKMGLTQEALARALGLQKAAVAKYEGGQVQNIKRHVILKMAEVLDCSPSYLMGWSEALHEDTASENPRFDSADIRVLSTDNENIAEDASFLLEVFSSMDENRRGMILEYCRHLKRIKEMEEAER